jgi:hypothetical protein
MNSQEKRKAREERKALKKQRKEEAKQKKKGVFTGFGTSSSKSSYTGSSSTSSGTSGSGWGANWWVKDYGTKKTGEAVSSYWTSRLDNSWYGGYGVYSYTKEDGTDFAAVLNTIRRSANIVTNAEKNGDNKEERELNVRWAQSEKDRNTAKGTEVFLSPTVVDKNTTKKKSWSDDERADVLIGEALVQSTMKHTVDAATEKKMCEGNTTKRGHLENVVWTVAEHLYAEKEVLENYPGFKGYFAANRAYYTGSDTKSKFEKTIKSAEDENKLDPMAAASGFVWDILHPSETLDKIPERMKEFITWSKERLATETTSQGRAEAAKEIVSQAYRIFQIGDDDGSSEMTPEIAGVGEILGEPGISELERDEEIEFQTVDDLTEDPKKSSKKNPHAVPPSLEGSDWQGGTIDYKVKGNAANYQKMVGQLSHIIKDVRNRIKIRSEEQRMIEHALKKGRLDEGSIYKIAFSKFDYHDEKLFEQEEIISMPSVAFGILVDESGSMSGYGGSKTKSAYARDVCIILAEALKGLEGIQLGVWGHTCEGHYQGGCTPGDELAIHQYYTPEHPEMTGLEKISAFSNNLDGYAIAYVAKQMDKHYKDSPTKVLIHISDGMPHAYGYGGTRAMNHMLGISKLAKQKGIKVIGIGVCNAFDQASGNAMYGPGNFVILNGMTGFQSIITNLVTRVANSRF